MNDPEPPECLTDEQIAAQRAHETARAALIECREKLKQ
jgi:hypothetical protein